MIRTRQHLSALVAHERALLLVLLRFQDELRAESDLNLPSLNVNTLGITPQELATAEKLVQSLVGEFKPEKYQDEYRHDLRKRIQRKVKAGEVNTVPEETEKAKPERPANTDEIDLSALLAQSVRGGAKAKSRANVERTSRRPQKTPRAPARGEKPRRRSA